MKDNETTVEMMTRFIDIVNCLEALGKTYKESEKVMKILKSLPTKWDAKVIAIQKAKDLTKLSLEELMGLLMIYEITMTKKQDSKDKKKNNIAQKASTKEEGEVEKENDSEKHEDLALITRKFRKFMNGERFKGRKYSSKRDPQKKEATSNGDKENKEEKKDVVCYKCKKLGHIKYDCSLYKSEAKKGKKNAMVATWSDCEGNSSKEENEKEMTNMCFMAIDEVNFNINYDDLHDAFEDLYENLERLGLKNASLKKKIQELEKELGKMNFFLFQMLKFLKLLLKKRMKSWKRKMNGWSPFSFFLYLFICIKKSFKMILISQKCILDKKG